MDIWGQISILALRANNQHWRPAIIGHAKTNILQHVLYSLLIVLNSPSILHYLLYVWHAYHVVFRNASPYRPVVCYMVELSNFEYFLKIKTLLTSRISFANTSISKRVNNLVFFLSSFWYLVLLNPSNCHVLAVASNIQHLIKYSIKVHSPLSTAMYSVDILKCMKFTVP